MKKIKTIVIIFVGLIIVTSPIMCGFTTYIYLKTNSLLHLILSIFLGAISTMLLIGGVVKTKQKNKASGKCAECK